MFDFFIRSFAVKNAQAFIDKLTPKVDIHIPKDLPLPAISTVKRLSRTVAAINGFEEQTRRLSDEQLKAKTEEFRARYLQAVRDPLEQCRQAEQRYRQATSGEEREQLGTDIGILKDEIKKIKKRVLSELLPEAFAVVRETGRRTIGLRHFDVQMIGGMVLHEGRIAEMATGEGKTLVSTLPAYLNALTGQGVHIVTVNDYLAKRDREWMGPIFEFLGLTVGVIVHDLGNAERQEAYRCDITYGTNNEFGFDYLRDNMVSFKEEMVQRYHHFAIVDEVDSILIDEARTPLIISGPAEESTGKYYTANQIALGLKGRRITEAEQIDAKYKQLDLTTGFDYIADEKARSIALTDAGEEKAARQFGIGNIHDLDTMEHRHHILQALKAKEFFKRDVDYVVRDGEVIIVDEFTGRLMPGRRWSDGLHQAVEAKEGIKIERENQTLATITFQNFFRMYEKLAGMTGTAYTEANEFKEIYTLDTVVIPTNRVLRRANHSDCIYKTGREKFAAVVAEIEEFYKKGQPVLVGTISIEKSELLSTMLRMRGIEHQVLNAKYHEREAQIVSQAGRYRAVTIATNMAGRGTDIVLGGNAEFLAKTLAAQKIASGEDGASAEGQDALVQKFLAQFREQVAKEHVQVVEAGGLHVIGTERHESRRIDNQLRGRSGRQGDPGSSRFFIALDDDLMRLFASDRIVAIMERLGMEEGQVIEHPLVTRTLEIAQKRVENHNFEIRKQLLEYDNVMNKQREAVYGLRRVILESENVKDHVLDAIAEVAGAAVDQYLTAGQEETGADLEGLDLYLKSKFVLDVGPQRREEWPQLPPDEIKKLLEAELLKLYDLKEQEFGAPSLRQLEKFVLLNIIDAKWKEHLYAMDQMREGVGLRAYAQRDPLVEYKREGFEMFQMMFSSINQEVAETMFRVRPVSEQRRAPRGVFSALPQKLVHNEFSSLSAANPSAPAPFAPASPAAGPVPASEPPSAPEPFRKTGPRVGRNDPCPCGSGKKYKKCCGQ